MVAFDMKRIENKRMKDKENRKVEGQLTTGEIIEINGKKYKR